MQGNLEEDTLVPFDVDDSFDQFIYISFVCKKHTTWHLYILQEVNNKKDYMEVLQIQLEVEVAST